MIGWLFRKIKEFHDAGQQLEALKAEEKRTLDNVHQAVQSGALSGEQLESVSLCCESITINLKKGTDKVRGGGK